LDPVRFDSLARSLTAAGSRRQALAAALIGTLGLLDRAHPDDAVAKKKPCPPCKKRKNGKCKKTLPDGTACSGGTCQAGRCIAASAQSQPAGPTCSDGIRNGSETDVDCGGTCPRCADFKTCASRDDCRGALCQGDVCRVCDPALTTECGKDAVGSCTCQKRNDGQRFCAQTNLTTARECSQCPTGTNCVDIGALDVRCFKLCGSS
jgi:hypothetical protein